MEHIHKQMPLDGIWHNETITGVPVRLTAMDQNGTAIDIGTVTTNGYYGTFGYEWTPPTAGTYEIIASFEGDDSYGSSGAATTLSVGQKSTGAQTTTTPTATQSDITPLYYGLAIGVIAIIIAIAIATVIITRRH